tara:strand:- start:35 stop:226 length:192 start_codon:yes stop_codon:yes gene_type:complete
LLLNYSVIFAVYYLAKFFQLVGIVVISIAVFFYWPNPMDENILIYGSCFFIAGWIIEKYLLKG